MKNPEKSQPTGDNLKITDEFLEWLKEQAKKDGKEFNRWKNYGRFEVKEKDG